MSEELKHIKVVTPELQEDGSIKYTTESYYDELTCNSVELEKQILTGRKTLLKDLIDCLDSDREITLKIKFKHKEPVLIVKRWLVDKESFNRR